MHNVKSAVKMHYCACMIKDYICIACHDLHLVAHKASEGQIMTEKLRKTEEEESSDKLPSREAIKWTLLLSLQTGGWKTKR